MYFSSFIGQITQGVTNMLLLHDIQLLNDIILIRSSSRFVLLGVVWVISVPNFAILWEWSVKATPIILVHWFACPQSVPWLVVNLAFRALSHSLPVNKVGSREEVPAVGNRVVLARLNDSPAVLFVPAACSEERGISHYVSE